MEYIEQMFDNRTKAKQSTNKNQLENSRKKHNASQKNGNRYSKKNTLTLTRAHWHNHRETKNNNVLYNNRWKCSFAIPIWTIDKIFCVVATWNRFSFLQKEWRKKPKQFDGVLLMLFSHLVFMSVGKLRKELALFPSCFLLRFDNGYFGLLSSKKLKECTRNIK